MMTSTRLICYVCALWALLLCASPTLAQERTPESPPYGDEAAPSPSLPAEPEAPASTPEPGPERETDAGPIQNSIPIPNDDGALAPPPFDPEAPWNQDVSPSQRKRAQALLQEGKERALKDQYATAARKFRQALELWQHPLIYYNLAIVSFRLGDMADAFDTMNHATASGKDALGATRYAIATGVLEELNEHIARVHVRCDTPGAEVTVSGRYLFTGPGTHTTAVEVGRLYLVEAKKAGYIADLQQIVVPAGQEARVHLVIKEHVVERRMPTWLPWTALGLGAMTAASGAYFQWAADREFATYDELIVQSCGPGCSEQGVPDVVARHRRQGEKLRTWAMVNSIAGGFVAASATIAIVLNRPRSIERPLEIPSDRADAAANSRKDMAWQYRPIITPGHVGVSIDVRY